MYNFWGHHPVKIQEGKKRLKFSTFYNNFGLWLRISLDWIAISTSGKRRYQTQSLPCWTKKLVNFGPLTAEITWLMFTYPKSSVHNLHMLMHLTSHYVTLPPGEFRLHEFFHQLDLGCWANSDWALAQISSFLFIYFNWNEHSRQGV